MVAFCLPKRYVSAFVDALKSGEVDPDKLMDMSSADRRTFFEPIVGKGNAQDVNALFESKMVLKDQKRGLLSWAKTLTNVSEPAKRDIVSKIEKLDSVLNPEDEKGFLADLAAQKLGVTVTAEEAGKITALAKTAIEEREKPTDEMSGVSSDYINAEQDLRHYVNSLMPVTAAKAIGKDILTTGRNFLLMNPSTPIKTAIGQMENYLTDLMTRRFGFGGGAAADLAKAANKQAWQQFLETGVNVASDENGALGEKSSFAKREGMLSTNPALHAVESATRAAANISTKIAIDWEHNYSFVKFYQKTFFDMLNVMSTKIAKSEGLAGPALEQRAQEILADGAKLKPGSEAGKLARSQSQNQAARVTSTNKNLVADLSLTLKRWLNGAYDGLGDAIIPIAKIPATLLYNSIENAGVGVPLGIKDMLQGAKKMRSEVQDEKLEGLAQYGGGIQKLIRVAGTMGVAAYLTSQMTKDDFRTDKYGGHFVKVAGMWINTEYIAAVSASLAGMMEIKKSGYAGQGVGEYVNQYTHGAAQALRHLPGLDEIGELVNNIASTNVIKGTEKYVTNLISDRYVPAMVQNLFKDRPIDRILFGAHGVESEEQVAKDTADAKSNKLLGRLGSEKYGMDVWGRAPSERAEVADDPVAKELNQLGYAPGFPEDRIKKVELTPEQYQDFIQTSGRLARTNIENDMSLPGWSDFPARARLKLIKRSVERARKSAENQIMIGDLAISPPGESIMDRATALKRAEPQPAQQ
jgi:hypothetical protein